MTHRCFPLTDSEDNMIFTWLAFTFLTALVAHYKGRSVIGWAGLGLVFSVFAFIAVVVMPKVEEPK